MPSTDKISAGRSSAGMPTPAQAVFGVYMSIDFSPKTGVTRVTHEEVGLYTIKNDTVTREEFFYEGAFL